MIVKQVASKGKSSFKGLAAYLLDLKNDGEKVERYDFSNCPFDLVEENISYIKQMQELNQMVHSDKSLHLVVSFQEEEFPSQEVLADIEMELLKSLNMQEHHRLSVSHNNTNNFHLHIAVNRLNPQTNLLVDPWKSKMKLQKKAEELEEKHKLKKDNHPVQLILDEKVFLAEGNKSSNTKDNQYKDQEIHSGMKNLLTWIKEEALDEILEVLNHSTSTYED
ncbi:MAG: TraI protein, partial [uncultured Sulfurovum sp.]